MDLLILPQDVLSHKIFNYLNYDILALTNKKYWLLYYNIRISYLKKNKSYHRFLIRNDYSFIYKNFLNKTLDILVKNKKFKYKNKYFTRHIDLSIYLIDEYNASKCKNIVKNIMKENKIIFKKIKTNKHIWTN
jgi:hypothetical protein